jgi:hypothetical protein
MRLLRAALFLEFGFVLIVVPWSAYWDRNYFVSFLPAVHELLINNFARGAVSGLGVLNIAAGVVELVSMYANRAPAVTTLSVHSSQPTEDQP